MRILKGLCFVLAGCLAAFTGCERPVIQADTFFPELEIVNMDSEVRGGEDFLFRITSNHQSFVLDSWSMDRRMGLNGREVAAGQSYQSGMLFTLRGVTVSETHRGELSVSVSDPETGFSKTLSKPYTAYNVASMSLEVVTPKVMEGGDVKIRIHSSHDMFEVRSLYSDIGFEGLVEGRSYTVGKDGYVEFVSRGIKVEKNEDREIRMMLVDSESGVQSAVSGKVSVTRETVVSMALTDYQGNPLKVIYNGDDVYFRVYDTQPTFVVENFYCELGNFVSAGATCRISSLGYYENVIRKVKVDSDYEGMVTMVLNDPVNGESYKLDYPFSARKSR